MQNHSPLSNLDIASIEELYQQYLKNPESVDESWRNFFLGFDLAAQNYSSKPLSGKQQIQLDKEFKILSLIQGYRQRGHLFTRTNPLRSRRLKTSVITSGVIACFSRFLRTSARERGR